MYTIFTHSVTICVSDDSTQTRIIIISIVHLIIQYTYGYEDI